jgi:hypothetical protein
MTEAIAVANPLQVIDTSRFHIDPDRLKVKIDFTPAIRLPGGR